MDPNHAAASSKPGSSRSTSNDALRLGSSSSSRSSSSSQPAAGATLGDLDADGAALLRALIWRIKDHGIDQEIMHDVMRSLLALSTHWLGSYAVEACILRCPTPVHRELVASTFAALRDHELAQMAQDEYGSCVLQRFLLSAAGEDFPEQEQKQVRELARRIEQLPGTVLEQKHAKQTKVIRRMFARRGD